MDGASQIDNAALTPSQQESVLLQLALLTGGNAASDSQGDRASGGLPRLPVQPAGAQFHGEPLDLDIGPVLFGGAEDYQGPMDSGLGLGYRAELGQPPSNAGSHPIKKRTNSFRNWCFTLNNPTDDESKSIVQLANEDLRDSLYVRFFVVGVERGEQGTKHFQGFVQFERAVPMDVVKKRLKFLARAHLEACKGIYKFYD